MAASAALRPEVATLLDHLRAQRFSGAEQLLEALATANARDDEGRNIFHQVTAEAREEMIKPEEEAVWLVRLNLWCDRSPESYAPFLMRGYFYVGYAWEARGTSWGANVPGAAWKLFEDRLAQAEADLRRAHTLAPKLAGALRELMVVARGRSEPEMLERWFTEGVAAQPDNMDLYFERLESLKAKWGGSHEAMFAFARRAVLEHPDDPMFGLLVVNSHLELANRTDSTHHKKYFVQPKVWQEVRELLERILAKYPRSFRNHNRMALYAFYGEDYARSRQEFEAVGDHWEPDVWVTQDYFKCIRDDVMKRTQHAVP